MARLEIPLLLRDATLGDAVDRLIRANRGGSSMSVVAVETSAGIMMVEAGPLVEKAKEKPKLRLAKFATIENGGIRRAKSLKADMVEAAPDVTDSFGQAPDKMKLQIVTSDAAAIARYAVFLPLCRCTGEGRHIASADELREKGKCNVCGEKTVCSDPVL